MVDGATAYAVGGNGAIIKTIDGGQNWTPQASGVAYVLYDVAASDANNVCIVGAGPSVLTTADGGATAWAVQPWQFDRNLHSVVAFDAATRWIAGDSGPILSSFNPNTLAVASLKGDPGDTKVTVSWTNPVGFGSVMVYFSTLRCASSVYDTYGQQLAYEGTGTSLTRTGLQNSTNYYFTVFVSNGLGTWSKGQTLVLAPVPTFKPTLVVKPSTAAAGHAIKFSGKVTPASVASGNKINIQRFTGSWKTFATATVKADGSYAVSKKLTRGSYKVRAYMPAVAGKALAGSSASRYATWK